MKYILGDSGKKLLQSMAMANTLFAFDFDGTLAPIVKDPEAAFMKDSVLQALKKLARKRKVAIISGRSIEDLKKRVPKDLQLVGNHGLEGLPGGARNLDTLSKVISEWRKQLAKSKGFSDPEIRVEDKEFSLAIHYRNSRAKKEAKRDIFSMVSELQPSPRVIMGKSVFNLVPPGAPHKGVALLELMSHHSFNAAFYIGDDDTDEDLFSLPDQRILTVRVGKKKTSQAQFYLDRQSEIKALLDRIEKFCD